MTLDKCIKGTTCYIKSIVVEERVLRRLEALGFIKGTQVEITNKKRYGAVIIKVRGTRMALGKHIASGIEVEIE